MTEFSVGATNYTLAALPSVSAPMICRKVGTSSATYVPANLMKKVIAALIGFAAIALPQSAIAQPVANRDELNNIIISGTGLAAGTFVKIYYPQVLIRATLQHQEPVIS
jgi:hypothetical protein